ncbi:MAG TPA: PPC domain-containing protein, partial [Flavobacterium sp.]|uniref:PPC domain-containing protein n=1 Tax=Flavobacterium sp. TaxID=239 RepID=UPI002ED136B0
MKKNYLTKGIHTAIALKNLTFTILFFLAINNSILAQTSCATALPITINGSCITGASVSDGTQDAPTLSGCSPGTFRYERWYTFTVTSGPQNVNITGTTTNRNLYLQLISQSSACGGLTQIACANADTNTNNAQTETINATGLANGTYYIKVANVGNNNTMNLSSLCVTSPPSNDACAGAITL